MTEIVARFIGDPAGYVIKGLNIAEVVGMAENSRWIIGASRWMPARCGQREVMIDLGKAYLLETLPAENAKGVAA